MVRDLRKRNMDEAKEAEKRQEAIDSDEMPLEFMLKNMRDPANDLQFRAQMAARAAPFCHPQLQAILAVSVSASIILFERNLL